MCAGVYMPVPAKKVFWNSYFRIHIYEKRGDLIKCIPLHIKGLYRYRPNLAPFSVDQRYSFISRSKGRFFKKGTMTTFYL